MKPASPKPGAEGGAEVFPSQPLDTDIRSGVFEGGLDLLHPIAGPRVREYEIVPPLSGAERELVRMSRSYLAYVDTPPLR